MNEWQKHQLKVGAGWIVLEVIGEAQVVQTFKGYAPTLHVVDKSTNLEYFLYISAKSIAEGLEPLRLKNNGNFAGLKFKIKKANDDRFAKYEVKE